MDRSYENQSKLIDISCPQRLVITVHVKPNKKGFHLIIYCERFPLIKGTRALNPRPCGRKEYRQSGNSGGATSLPPRPMVISHSPHEGKEGELELEKRAGISGRGLKACISKGIFLIFYNLTINLHQAFQ